MKYILWGSFSPSVKDQIKCKNIVVTFIPSFHPSYTHNDTEGKTLFGKLMHWQGNLCIWREILPFCT